MEATAKELAKILNGTVEGDSEAVIKTFAKIENGKSGAISFYANPKYEEYVYICKSSVIIVNKDFQPAKPVQATMLRVDDAYTAVAQLLKWAADQRKTYRRRRSFLSRVSPSARLGRKVWVGDFVTVGARTKVGDRTKICNNVTIGRDCKIGKNCLFYPGVRIYPGTIIGNGVIVHENAVIGSDGFGNAPQPDGTWEKIEHLGNVIIGDGSEIGTGTTIDRAQMESTIIGKGVKIDNLCMIAHNVEIGDNTVMAAQCGIAGSSKIGKNCILAGQIGVSGHISIADNTIIGAKSGILSSIKEPGSVLMGAPAFSKVAYLRAYAKFRRSGME